MINYTFAFMFGLSTLLFAGLTLLVLKSSRNKINASFAFGTAALAIASFICFLAFSGVSEELGLIGNIVMIWAPFGLLLSARLIIYGPDAYKDAFSIGLTVLLLFVSALYVTTFVDLGRGVIAGAIFLDVLFLVTIYHFYKVAKLVPDQENKIFTLIFGLTITTISFLGAVTFTDEVFGLALNTIFGLFVNIGIIIAALAFTTIPNKFSLSTNDSVAAIAD